ncbi:hypothetical protein ABS772_17155 [Methylorubrum podarium]|uniref:Uncharacterized protein n=1 Tax=Methylorubrum podarium TaxID=200476 RepID=A0ABV1QQF6_9HYPH
MVRLSAKAFRFAEDATHALVEARVLRDGPRAAWENWSSEDHTAAAYVEVPDPVAEIMRSAVAMRVDQMQRHFDRDDDPDPEIGNDLAFLRNVLVALSAGGSETPQQAGY